MFPIGDFVKRWREILAALDEFADGAALPADDAEALDDLNAELDDALMLLEDIRADAPDAREQLADALEELDALAGDYRALAARAPGLDALTQRLGMTVRLAADNLEG